MSSTFMPNGFPLEPSQLVLDIGGSQLHEHLSSSIVKNLTRKDVYGRYFLPDVCFSDDAGLALWERINRLPEYYQTRDEVALLEEHGAEVAAHVQAVGCVIIDLGCGDTRKVLPLLSHLAALDVPVTYLGLDLSLPVLERAIRTVRAGLPQLRAHGLWGTFEDGLKWIQAADKVQAANGTQTTAHATLLPPSLPRLFLSLGSIFGNDRPVRAARYLATWAAALRHASGDRLLLGIDATPDRGRVWRSYHDEGGVFEGFVWSAFGHAGRVLSEAGAENAGAGTDHDGAASRTPCDIFQKVNWELRGVLDAQASEGKYVASVEGQEKAAREDLVHRFVLRARRAVAHSPTGISFAAGEEVECYEARKNGPGTVRGILAAAGLREVQAWEGPEGQIWEYLVEPAAGQGSSGDAVVRNGGVEGTTTTA